MGKRLDETIPFTGESLTAHIMVANVKFQFSTIAASQIVKVIKKLRNNSYIEYLIASLESENKESIIMGKILLIISCYG